MNFILNFERRTQTLIRSISRQNIYCIVNGEIAFSVSFYKRKHASRNGKNTKGNKILLAVHENVYVEWIS